MSEIVLKNIQMTLDPASIEKAIREVELLRGSLKPALDAFCDWLASYGEEVAVANIVQLGAVSTGALMNSVKSGREGDVWFVSAGDENTEIETRDGYSITNYALFVEYGTGMIKASEIHPSYRLNKMAEEYNRKRNYNINKHTPRNGKFEVNGWVFKTGEAGNKDSGHFYTTQGQPARPFMYNTLLDLRREAELVGGKMVAQYIR